MEKKDFKIVFGKWSDDSYRDSIVVNSVHELQGALCCLKSERNYRLLDVIQL